MYSKLPAEVGETPTKVVFEGVEPGSPAAQRLYQQNMGEISSFHQKARQNRLISALPVLYMQEVLPDGGQLRYQFNNGQESIHVRLSPRQIAEAKGEQTPEAIKDFIKPVLAIDVLFGLEMYLSGDVYSFSEGVTQVPDPAADHTDPANWNLLSMPSMFLSQLHGPVSSLTGVSWEGLFVTGDGGGTPTYATMNQIAEGWWDGFAPTQGPIGLDGPGASQAAYGVGDLRGAYPPATFSTGAISRWAVIEVSDPYPMVPPLAPTGRETVLYEYRAGTPIWVGPTVPGIGVANVRDQYSYFNAVNMAGIVAHYGDQLHEAVSPGGTGQLAPDGRLRVVEILPGGPGITRAMDGGDPPPVGVTGAGFAAVPARLQDASEKPEKVAFDIYVASVNTVKTNTYPGPEGATFEVDDPSFTYAFKPELNIRVRAREYVDTALVGVQAVVSSERKTKHFTSDPPASDPPGTEPTVEGEDVFGPSGRTVRWRFAVDNDWTDLGGEPADPTAPGMGELIADTGLLNKTVASPPLDRVVHETPVWSGSVAGMTKIASIEWTPPVERGKHGTAVITLA